LPHAQVDAIEHGSTRLEPEGDVAQLDSGTGLGGAQMPTRIGKNRFVEDVLDAAEPGE
jgi:hypothetical protein